MAENLANKVPRAAVSRRAALCAFAGAACAAAAAARTAGPADVPKSGTDDPAFASFDDLIVPFMRAHQVPGASLAVTRNGRLVYARGYGWGDVEAQAPYLPTNLFRIASLSKSITSAACLTVVQAGKLDLDAPAFALLGLEPHVEPGATVDPRLRQVTVRHLLHHTGGFDRDKSGDPMFMPRRIARSVGVVSPPGPRDIIRYVMGRPLDSDPGTAYAYSNVGYCVLGRVIEKLAGTAYQDTAVHSVLRPTGVSRMRLAKSRLAERAPNEVRYYDGGNRHTASIFASDSGTSVPVQYGGWCIESMDAHGGWLASVVDLARFAAALDGVESPILSARSRATLYERPAPPVGFEANGKPAAAYYGMGWMVRPTSDGRANYWHTGKLDGSSSLLVRRHDGLSWVLNFNSESPSGSYAGMLDGPLHRAADAVRAWPSHDLFSEFGVSG